MLHPSHNGLLSWFVRVFAVHPPKNDFHPALYVDHSFLLLKSQLKNHLFKEEAPSSHLYYFILSYLFTAFFDTTFLVLYFETSMTFKFIYTSSKWYLRIRNILMFPEYFIAINTTWKYSLSLFFFLIVLSSSSRLSEGRCLVCHVDYCTSVLRTMPRTYQALGKCLLNK